MLKRVHVHASAVTFVTMLLLGLSLAAKRKVQASSELAHILLGVVPQTAVGRQNMESRRPTNNELAPCDL